tara:strand:- start:178 stop:351 length:174 start_codon:yes stop_codon:yes gene_type:complete
VQVIAQALKDEGEEAFENEGILEWMDMVNIHPDKIKEAFTLADGKINLRYIMERLDE